MKWLGILAATATANLTAATLEGFAKLPAYSLVPGPESGHFIEAPSGIKTPFQGQIAQGISAIIPDGKGAYLALADNGFGSPENSADVLLRIYFLEPDFRTETGGLGTVFINGYVDLSDPGKHMPYRITADLECYSGTDPCHQVERRIRSNRLLTGSDLDPESLAMERDNSFWIGDEIGPYLLHFRNDGTLLDPPYELPGLVSARRPGSAIEDQTLAGSRGFEGMARSIFGDMLYPMLEGPVKNDQPTLNIYTFNMDSRAFENEHALQPSHRYLLETQGTAIGAFKLFGTTTGLVLERDSGQGDEARHKKIYRIDFEQKDSEGYLLKEELVDLLKVDDPHDLNRDGKQTYAMPMQTIEGLVVLEQDLIAVISDNNYPFGHARGTAPEATEFILIRTRDLW